MFLQQASHTPSIGGFGLTPPKADYNSHPHGDSHIARRSAAGPGTFPFAGGDGEVPGIL